MDVFGEHDLEAALREATEIGVGALILGLRRLNINRRDFVDQVPAAEPVINAVLEQIEELTPPVSAAVGALVTAIGDAVPGDHGERLRRTGVTLAEAGPELLRLSGLTKRD